MARHIASPRALERAAIGCARSWNEDWNEITNERRIYWRDIARRRLEWMMN